MNAVLQNLDQLDEALASLKTGADYTQVLDRVRVHLTRFADLEKRIQGHVTVPVSRNQLTEEGGIEDLARREHRRLTEENPDAADVMHLLDRDGLKVYRPVFPAGGRLLGFFLFDREVGPALVGDARLSTPRANVLFARLFGHYLLDNDPYRIRLVVDGDETEGPARAFAAAFLIDVDELGRYLSALRWTRDREVTGEEVAQLAAFFEVPETTVTARLQTLGIPGAAAAREPEPGGEVEPVISGRFVRLALEVHARGGLDTRELAEYLETDEEAARGLAGRFRMSDTEGGLDSDQSGG